jgi:chemotaxis protein methyltransferase CheR
MTVAEVETLSRACGIPLHAYRPEHVSERIERALERESVRSAVDLAGLLRRCDAARDRFRRAVAISVTGRFRDPHQFDLLRDRILPDLLTGEGPLRVWSAGCATGLELYGVASLVDELGALSRARLLGSDLLEQNIAAARAGGDDGVPPTSAIAARTRWEVRDLTEPGAPEGRFDLILCRNVGIYFAPAARGRLMAKLSGALAPGGVLLLGRSERLVAPGELGLSNYAPHAYRRPA